MDIRLRIAGTGVLAVAAVYCAVSALTGINAPEKESPTPPPETELAADLEGAGYVLRPWDGFVAVFDSAAAKAPQAVTEIAVDQLRSADRSLLERGIPAGDRDELLTLLEDLGS